MLVLSRSEKTWLALLLTIFWLCATAYAFWWFQIKNLRPFDTNMSLVIEDKALASNIKRLVLDTDRNPPAKGYILNFWKPGCSCNRFNVSHVKNIIEDYQVQGFKLVTLVSLQPDYTPQQLTELAQEKFGSAVIIDDHQLFKDASRIPATPSAAILSSNGQLNYFGPYNEGTFCGLGGTRFVETVADLILQNETPNIINTLSYGCFCNWA